MVVVVVKQEQDDDAAAAAWGTWEELVLGGAVLRHGAADWRAVAAELRARSPCSFSPKECEAKFSEIQARYSACDAWFEELRKQRVAELKRELRKSESFIGSLQSVIESLSNSKHDNGNNLGCHTESCSHTENAADTTSSSKELSKDRSSAASFTEEASNSQKSQKVQNTSAETLSKPHAEKKLCAKDGLLWGSRKKRGLRDKRAILMAVDSSRDGENTSTPCIQGEGSSEGCMKKLKTPKTKPGVSVCEGAKPKLADIMNSISTQGDCKMLQHQIDIQRKRARYKKMIRQHMDFRILRSKIKSGAISSAKELLKDMLVFVNNVLTFFPKATLEHMAAIELRGLICKTWQQSSVVLSMNCEAAGITSDPVIKKTKARFASGPVIKKTAAAVIAAEPVLKKTMAAIASEPVIKKTMAGIASEPVMKKTGAGIASEAVIKKAAARVASDPVSKKAAAGATIAPTSKKISRTLLPVRHVPRDAKRSKVSSRETGSTVSQGESETRDVHADAAATAEEETVERSAPAAKKRGVGRPPKSGQKRAAPPPQDSPSKGRKRSRR
uniref:Bromo domain-containing protein n=1 Tax=Aegilops tauschii subsp. strangulata TaxID=200361 RepID=A0A453B9I7_AEGTS